MARPRLRCLEDVENDLREMKFKRWRHKAVDRVEMAFILKEAKALIGPQGQKEVSTKPNNAN